MLLLPVATVIHMQLYLLDHPVPWVEMVEVKPVPKPWEDDWGDEDSLPDEPAKPEDSSTIPALVNILNDWGRKQRGG